MGFQSDGFSDVRQSDGFRSPLSILPTAGYARGGRLVFLTVATIGVGEAGFSSEVRDSTDRFLIQWATQLVADITASGAGGLDTGAEAADTWYNVFVIADTRGVNSPAALLSLSATSPTLPATHNVFRRLGAVRNDSTPDIIGFVHDGDGTDRRYHYSTLNSARLALSGGAAVGFAVVDLSAFVPPTSREGILQLRETGTQDVFFSANQGISVFALQQGNEVLDPVFPTDASQQIDYAHLGAGGSTDIVVQGFSERI